MSIRRRAWAYFDLLVNQAPSKDENPWVVDRSGHRQFEPDTTTLRKLLGVPVLLDASSQSGVPALALDVWVAFELRRAGFDPDLVWPRASAPRFMPSEVAALRAGLSRSARIDFDRRLAAGVGLKGAVGSSANILGKNYVKQVDVGISRWNTGPELMVSTKRMDSSFAKNAANRVEESYGDAKNLRLRHPLAALGFVYALRSTALAQEPDKTAWLVDLLTKLGREEDAYDAVMLLIPDWTQAYVEPAPEASASLERTPTALGPTDATTTANPNDDLDPELVPEVGLREDAVPSPLKPHHVFRVLIEKVLDNSPVNFHRAARARIVNPRAV